MLSNFLANLFSKIQGIVLNVSPNRSTVSSSGDATSSANSDSLTLGFRERTSALHFSGFKIILLLRNHSQTTIFPFCGSNEQNVEVTNVEIASVSDCHLLEGAGGLVQMGGGSLNVM